MSPEAVVQRCSVKKGILRNFAKFTGKHLCQSLFLNKVAVLGPETLFKKRLWHRCCFPVNFVKFLRNLFLQNTSGGCFYESLNELIYLELIETHLLQHLLTSVVHYKSKR